MSGPKEVAGEDGCEGREGVYALNELRGKESEWGWAAEGGKGGIEGGVGQRGVRAGERGLAVPASGWEGRNVHSLLASMFATANACSLAASE